MTDPVQSQLLGHLLGVLEDHEQQEMAERLQREPRLDEELDRVRRWLEPLEAARTDFTPPPGLAERTSRFVAAHAAPDGPAPLQRPASYAETSPSAASDGFRWVDVVAAAAVLIAASLLLIPAVHSSRFNARLVACQNNLRELGLALIKFSRSHDGYFPAIPARGKLAFDGIYVALLRSDGLLSDSRWLICPGSPQADGRELPEVTYEELEAASEEELSRLRPTIGGSYGMHLGHFEDGAYHNTRNLGRVFFPILSDVPAFGQAGFQSLHHGGRGQNVFFEDGHVDFLTTPRPYPHADHIFLNAAGVVAAGVDADDAVIGTSEARPILGVSWRP